MRRGITAACVILLLISCAWARKRQTVPEPNEFVIGRHTSFDFGPPNDYYELFIVTGTADGTSIKRLTLTPAANACTLPAKVETASASIRQPISELLGTMNPCAISEKDLHRELKRCKNCLVFSYAEVAMQVQCGTETRVIRSKILDRDMFGPRRADTPKNTSWTMQLMSRLDDGVGPGVMEKPMFAVYDESKQSLDQVDTPIFRDLGAGKYDGLFPSAPDRLSAVYLEAQKPVVPPTVKLVSVGPFSPETADLPAYPGIARLAHVEGAVSFSFYVGTDGKPAGIVFQDGPGLLRRSVTDAASRWTFQQVGSLQEMHATIEFRLNCPIPQK